MKLKIQHLYFIVFFLNIFNPFFNAILRSWGFYGFMSLFRDAGILFTLIQLVVLKKIKKDEIIIFASFFIFIFVYILQSIFQSKFTIGLSFLRVYTIPVLFLYVSYKFYSYYSIKEKHIKFILKINFLSILISLIVVLLFYIKRELVFNLYSLKGLSGNWLLMGSKIFRAGWPIGGPNQLGVMSASFLIIYLIIFNENKIKTINIKNIFIVFILNAIVLVLTFSRSAWLFLFVYVFIYYFLYKGKVKISFLLSGILIVTLVLTVIYTTYSEAVLGWIESVLNFSDSSSHGHMDSIKNAFSNIENYILTGYTKGTVGPRAYVYGFKLYNVENTFLLSLMDFGIVAFTLYYFVVFSLLLKIVKFKDQLIYCLSIFIPVMLLPYSQDMETLINLSFFITMIGLIKKMFLYKKNYNI